MKTKVLFLLSLVFIFYSTSKAQVGLWGLNNNTTDASSNSINGTIINGATFTTDSKEGSHALTTNGTNQYVNLGNPSTLPSGSSPRSMSAWAKTSNVVGNRVIVSFGSTGGSGQAMFISQSGTSLIGGGWTNNMTVTNFWTVGVWHHICLTYNGTTAKLYADGVEIASSARTWNLVLQRAYIGRGVNNNDYWSGTIDDVRIFNTALSASQVQALSALPPLAPTGVTATMASSSSINLSWTDASNNETGFQIERSLTSGTGFTLVTTTAANVVTFANAGLNAGTTYYYRIRAINATGNSTYSTEVNATTATAIPLLPTNLTATASSTSINLSWVDASNNETGFQIERSLTSGNGFALVTTTSANAVAYSDIGLTPATTYYYRIRSTNAGSSSAYTPEVTATTLQVIPLPPTNPVATAVSPSTINLSWSDASSNETGFQIERSLTTGSGFTLITTTVANAVSYSDASLAAGTIYYYRIRATNTGGNSAYTTEVSGTTFLAIPLLPTNPTALTTSSTSITLNWTDASNNETGFQIERSLTTGSGFTLITTTVANAVTYTDTGLTPGTSYYYRMRAINAAGNSNYTPEFIGTTGTVPSPPTSLTATPVSSTSVNLSWVDASNNETGFQVERSLTSGTGFSSVTITAANAASQIDAGLVPSTTYYYRVRAINAIGNSSYSSEISVSTPMAPSNAPSDLFAMSQSSTSINLNWKDNSTDETGFSIERSLNSANGFSSITTTEANIITYSDQGLTPGTTYFYRIRSVNTGGNSAYTLVADATPAVEGVTQLCKNFYCNPIGAVGVGTQVIPTGYKVAVKGKIIAEGVKVELQSSWPDYVFEKDYTLIDIPSLKRYIDVNGHLPSMPSANTIEREGFDVENINVLLLEKIEELSLYLIQLEERMKSLELENRKLKRHK